MVVELKIQVLGVSLLTADALAVWVEIEVCSSLAAAHFPLPGSIHMF